MKLPRRAQEARRAAPAGWSAAAVSPALARRAEPTTGSGSPRASSGSTRSRRTKVRLSCGPTAANRCKGVVSLTRGKKRADGPPARSASTANKNRNVTVRIKKSAYKRLKKRGSIKTTITVVTRGSDGVLRRKSQKRHDGRAKAAKKATKKQ